MHYESNSLIMGSQQRKDRNLGPEARSQKPEVRITRTFGQKSGSGSLSESGFKNSTPIPTPRDTVIALPLEQNLQIRNQESGIKTGTDTYLATMAMTIYIAIPAR
jgi:hypothetical protein